MKKDDQSCFCKINLPICSSQCFLTQPHDAGRTEKMQNFFNQMNEFSRCDFTMTLLLLFRGVSFQTTRKGSELACILLQRNCQGTQLGKSSSGLIGKRLFTSLCLYWLISWTSKYMWCCAFFFDRLFFIWGYMWFVNN